MKQKYIAIISILILFINFNCIGEIKTDGELSAFDRIQNYDRIQKDMDRTSRNVVDYQNNQKSMKKLVDDVQRNRDSTLRDIWKLKKDSTDNESKHILAILIPKDIREQINTYFFEYKIKQLNPLIEDYNGSMGFVDVEKIKGRCLVWDMEKNQKSHVHDQLPFSLQAEFWDDEITVFMISEDIITNSTIQSKVYMVNLPEKNLISVAIMSVPPNERCFLPKPEVIDDIPMTIPHTMTIEQFMTDYHN